MFIDKCQSSRPEINKDEGNKEQKLSCVQNIDDIEDLSSSDEVEEKTDPILSSRYFMSFLTLSASIVSYSERSVKSPAVIMNWLVSLFSCICFSLCIFKFCC